jgi:hypothetical protein
MVFLTLKIKDMENYTPTLSQVMNQLREEGYTVDFNLNDDCVHCHGGNIVLNPDEFHIDKYFRFEGNSDPDDNAILYAISSEKHQLKGVLVNGYGIYSESLTNNMIQKLRIDR